MAASAAKILLVDDKVDDGELASLILRRELENADVSLVGGAVMFAELLARGGFDMVITERHLEWADGGDILDSVKRLYPRCPVIFLTSLSDPRAALDAAKRGLDDYIPKGSAGLLLLSDAVRRLLVESSVKAGTEGRPVSTVDRLPVGVFTLSREGGINCLNRACQTMFGLVDHGRDESPALAGLLADGIYRSRLAEALEEGRSPIELDAQLEGAGSRWVRINLWPFAGAEQGGPYEGSVVDITGYKDAVHRLSLKAEELSRSNSDLEKFAYVASHDLQEPLSYISRYASLFSDRYGAQLDADAERYLGHIIDSAHRLQSMVDDILVYSRVSTHGSRFEAVDFGAAADAAAADLQRVFKEAKAIYERGTLPTLDADGRQIQQLFQNLFSNALKFRRSEPPRIQVDAQEEANYWRFSVKDNGIGIEPAAVERIFGMFQRLHTSEEYPGTGVGLAICRSIVERHGGKIWVDSEPGKGSNFFFTIPCNLWTGAMPQETGDAS